MTTASELTAWHGLVPVFYRKTGGQDKVWKKGNTMLLQPCASIPDARAAIHKYLSRVPEEGLGLGIFERRVVLNNMELNVWVAAVWEIKDSDYTAGEEGLSKAGAPVRDRYGKTKVPQ